MRFGIMAMQTGALLPAGLSAQEVMAHVASSASGTKKPMDTPTG